MTTSINNNNSNNNNDVLAFLAARRQQITTATGLAEETASAFEKQLDDWLLRVERNAINSEDGDVMNGERYGDVSWRSLVDLERDDCVPRWPPGFLRDAVGLNEVCCLSRVD